MSVQLRNDASTTVAIQLCQQRDDARDLAQRYEEETAQFAPLLKELKRWYINPGHLGRYDLNVLLEDAIDDYLDAIGEEW